MALHARDLIGEMVEEKENPKTSYLERLRNFAAARKLVRKHGGALIRETFSTLGQIEGFPPAQLLWNASHADVPLHCFFRTRIEPVFRVKSLLVEPMKIEISMEYGPQDKNKTIREKIILQRDACLQLEVAQRVTV